MSLHGLELGHVLGEQQSLLHRVGHIAGCPSLEVPDGGTGWKRGPIQHWGGGPGWRGDLRITPLLGAPLPHLGLLGRSLGLILLRGVGFSNFHHLLALRLHFSLQVGRFKSEGQGRAGGRGGKPSLGGLPRHIPPQLGLYQFQRGGPWLTLNPHLVKYWCEWMAEVKI